jgi:hypothetical protein
MKGKSSMKMLIVIPIFYCLIFLQLKAAPSIDSAAIKAAVLDYADGFYSGDAARMERAIHPDLHKIVVVKLPQTGKYMLQYSTYSQLIELTGAKVGLLEETKRKFQVTILEASEDMASVSLTSAMFNDYLELVKIDGKWKIVNVLWASGPDSPNRSSSDSTNVAGEQPAVKNIVNEYYDATFTADAVKMEHAIHPEISAAQFTRLLKGEHPLISRTGASALVEILRAKLRPIPEEQRKVDIKILDIMDTRAFVHATTPLANAYLHLAKIDNQWRIINVLSKPVPGAQQPGSPKK